MHGVEQKSLEEVLSSLTDGVAAALHGPRTAVSCAQSAQLRDGLTWGLSFCLSVCPPWRRTLKHCSWLGLGGRGSRSDFLLKRKLFLSQCTLPWPAATLLSMRTALPLLLH